MECLHSNKSIFHGCNNRSIHCGHLVLWLHLPFSLSFFISSFISTFLLPVFPSFLFILHSVIHWQSEERCAIHVNHFEFVCTFCGSHFGVIIIIPSQNSRGAWKFKKERDPCSRSKALFPPPPNICGTKCLTLPLFKAYIFLVSPPPDLKLHW